MGFLRVSKYFSILISVSVLLSSCSWGSEAENAPYPDSFSEVGWEWESSDPGRGGRIIPVPSGVVVVWEYTVVALAGETGRKRWSYSDEENQAEEVRISENSDYLVWKVVLEDLGVWEYGEEKAEHWLVDAATGEISHEIPVSGHVPPRLFTDSLYVQEERNKEGEDTRFAAYQISRKGNSDLLWTSEAHLKCETEPEFEVRNHDAVLAADVVVIPYTCVENEIAWRSSERQTVVAGLLGLDMENGEELWRSETTMEEASLYDSYNREIVPMNTDYMMVYGKNSQPEMFMDVRTGETVSDRRIVLPGPDDASWMVEYRGNEEYVRLGEGLSEEARVDFSFESDWNQIVPLGDGLATVADVESDPKAVFQAWDEESERVYVDLGIAGDQVLDVASVPGAVVVLYRSTETGDLGVIGLT